VVHDTNSQLRKSPVQRCGTHTFYHKASTVFLGAMADISLGERIYIVQGIEQDVRTDGRSRAQYRPLALEANVVAQADGSARLHLGPTDVLVGVKVCTLAVVHHHCCCCCCCCCCDTSCCMLLDTI
jgi:hypothetical protein